MSAVVLETTISSTWQSKTIHVMCGANVRFVLELKVPQLVKCPSPWGTQAACWILFWLFMGSHHCLITPDWACRLMPCQYQWCSNVTSLMGNHGTWCVNGPVTCSAYFTMCRSTRLLRAVAGSIYPGTCASVVISDSEQHEQDQTMTDFTGCA